MLGSKFRLRRETRGLAARLGLVAVAIVFAACGSSVSTASPAATTTSGANGTAAATSGGNAAKPWLDTSKTVDQRVALLLAQMTVDEKIGQMTQIENNSISPSAAAEALLGSVQSGGDGNPKGENTAENWYYMVSDYQDAALGTRLGIPLMYGVDMVHGVSHMTGTTIFPHNIGMGATHDAALVAQACQVTATESNAAGVRWTYSPVVAVPQDVRWGRTYEGFGENTELVTQLGTACIKALQGGKLTDPGTMAATAKHFIGDGGTAYGSSTTNIMNVQYALDQGVTEMDNATIEKMFLPPYQDAIKNGVRIVMTSFSSTQEGGRITGDKHWITDVLKGRLGFTGMVISDWGAVDQISNNYKEAVKAAVNAGEDMIMAPYDAKKFQTTLKSLVTAGDVSQARIDDAVTRILRVKFEMGLFETPMPPSGKWDTVGSAANRAIASKAVSESAVLLKTGSGVLPVKADASVLLAGVGADDIGISVGGWTLSWQGNAGEVTTGTTLKAALTSRLGAKLAFDAAGSFASGTHASVGIVVVAERPYAEGIGDSADLELPAGDMAVIAKVRPLVDKLIVVVISGRPMMLSGIVDKADAVIAAWLPGTEQQGIADVLLGSLPFTGTTPYTWPKTAADAPRTGKTACQGAVYPYGYGLDATGKLLGPAAC
jgi:beta-glucosidase